MILAPMQGLTEVLFRRAYEDCFPGALDSAIAPFISLTHGPLNNPAKLSDVLPENNRGSIPVIPQILGKEADEFVQVAQRLADWGYTEVNWNMGCPMRMVTAKHRGSGMLPYPEEVRRLMDTIVPRLPMALSVKVRLGLKDKEEIFRMVEVLNDYPLSSVTVHPRLGRQQYNGIPDLESYGKLLPLVKHPVIYNGDICTPADARKIKQLFPDTNDIMIGRGVLYRPTLPLEIKGSLASENERQAETRRFIRHLMRCIAEKFPNEESRIRKTKEYWCLLWKSLPISEMQARAVLREKDVNIVDKLIEKLAQ